VALLSTASIWFCTKAVRAWASRAWGPRPLTATNRGLVHGLLGLGRVTLLSRSPIQELHRQVQGPVFDPQVDLGGFEAAVPRQELDLAEIYPILHQGLDVPVAEIMGTQTDSRSFDGPGQQGGDAQRGEAEGGYSPKEARDFTRSRIASLRAAGLLVVQRQLGRIAPKEFVVGEVLQLQVPPQLGVHEGPHQGRQIQVLLQEGIQ
jgi:hypothetical protein